MVFKNQLCDRVKSGLCRCNLIEDIVAISVALHHALNAADLPFDTIQPGDKGRLKLMLALSGPFAGLFERTSFAMPGRFHNFAQTDTSCITIPL